MDNDQKLLEKMKQEILDTFYTEANKAAQKIAVIISSELQNAIGEKVIAPGNLQKSVSHEVNKAAWGYLIRVFSNVNYAALINDGTKPHYPSIEPIMKWVEKNGLHLNYSNKIKLSKASKTKHSAGYNARNVKYKVIAELIARKAAKKGAQGKKFFEIALKQSLPKIESELKNIDFSMGVN